MLRATAHQRFRIKTPTALLTIEHDRTHLTIAPIGAVVRIGEAERENLIDVVWNGKKFMMFADDLRSRAEQVGQRLPTEVARLAA